MRYSKRPDPLVTAIADGTLDTTQRAALADFVQLVVTEMSDGGVARPGTLMDQAMEASGRWETMVRLWDERRRDLYRALA